MLLPRRAADDLTVYPAVTDPPSCVVEGLGVGGSTAGVKALVELYAKDRFGNLVDDNTNEYQLRLFCVAGRCTELGEVDAEVEITNNLLPSDPMSNRDNRFAAVDGYPGYYLGNYYVTIAGQYNLVVELQGQGYVSTPSTRPIAIVPTLFSHQSTVAAGEGLVSGKAGTTALFTVTAKDMYDNQLTAGGIVFTTQIRGPGFYFGTVADQDDGTYRVSYEPRIRGRYTIEVRSRGQPIQGSGAWEFTCLPAATFADNTFAYGTGLTYTVAGTSSTFSIQAIDKFMIEQEEGGESSLFSIVVQEDLSETSEVLPFTAQNILDNAQGTYSVSYTVTRSGNFFLRVLYNNNTEENADACTLAATPGSQSCRDSGQCPCGTHDIIGSPFSLLVEPGETSPVHCAPVGLAEMAPIAGVEASFVVQTKDEYGNNGMVSARSAAAPRRCRAAAAAAPRAAAAHSAAHSAKTSPKSA